MLKTVIAILAGSLFSVAAYADANVKCTLYVTSVTGQSIQKEFGIGVSGDTKDIDLNRSFPFGNEVYDVLFYAHRATKSVSMYVTSGISKRRYVIMNGAYAQGVDLYGGADHPGFEGKGAVDIHCMVTE